MSFDLIPFGDLVKTVSARGHQIKRQEYLPDGKLPIIDQGEDLFCGWTDDDKLTLSRPHGVIIFGDHTRVVKFFKGDFAVGADGTKLLEPKSPDMPIEFLAYLTEFCANKITNLGYSRHFKELKEFSCPLAPVAEQERIVEILSDADAAIATAEKSHLTKHRQIAAISRASQKAGGEKYQLGTLFEFLNGLSGKTANDFGEGHPFVTYMGVFDGPFVKDNAYGLVQASSNEGQTVLKSGDILMTMTSETKPEAGFVSLYENAHQGEVFLNSFCACLRPKANKVIPEFAYCALSSPDFRRQIWRISQGSTRINLSKTEVKKLLLDIPSEEVQLGFAGSLRTTVEEIEKSKRLLTALKKQKRGLMQQLLTGKLRVPEKQEAKG